MSDSLDSLFDVKSETKLTKNQIVIGGLVVLFLLYLLCKKNSKENFRDYPVDWIYPGYPYRYTFGYASTLWPWDPSVSSFYDGYIVP